MYILKNAIKNIGRNKGRNIFIAIIIFAIISTSVIAIIINSTTKEIIDDYKSRFGSEVKISLDMEKLFKEQANGSGMINVDNSQFTTTEQYILFGQSSYIKSYTLTSTIDTSSKTIKSIDEDETSSGNMVPVNPSGGDINTDQSFTIPDLKIIGNTDSNNLTDFIDGSRKISEGRMYQNVGEVIISEDLAKLNNISIGQSIEVDIYSTEGDTTIELTVVGIYADYTKAYQNDFMKLAFLNRRNEILTSHDTITSIANEGMVQTSAKYYLKEPGMVDAFEAEIRGMGLGEYYTVSTDEASYNKIVQPVIGLSKISYTFMFIVIILGSIILILLSSSSIRERKYEIGVLRAMGMKKKNVAIGLLLEMVMITTMCLVVGLSVGAAIAQPVADTLLDKQVEIAVQANNTPSNGFGDMIIMGDVTEKEVEPLSDIDVSLNLQAMLQIIGISLLLAGVSSIAGISHITKYEPIKILSERS